MNKCVLEAINLSKVFSDGKLYVDVLKNINLKISAKEMVAIVGPSGSGKSTLLHILGGLDKPTSGSVTICGNEIANLSETKKGEMRNQCLGFVYQFHHLLPEFTALENTAMPLLIRGDDIKNAELKAREILAKVGLSKREEHRVGELSGGERQRVAIARALVTSPACVLADEPTGNLDHKTASHIYELISDLNAKLNVSFLIVTHDLSFAAKMQRVLHLENGEIISN